MYLGHLLHRDTSELIIKIYETQKLKTTKGDWFEIIQNERIQNKVSESDLVISLMSKDKFKRIVETKIEFQAIKYLRELAGTHSKSAFILNEKFGKKEYFNDIRFSKEDVQILFKLRTKMSNCKSNFKYQYGNNLTCRICEDENRMKITFSFVKKSLKGKQTSNSW